MTRNAETPVAKGTVERVALDILPDGVAAVVSACPSRKALEMGLAPGVTVRMMRNRRREHAVVVALDDARFVVSRAVAQRILVARNVPAVLPPDDLP